jgi:hypothetical protein
VAGGAEAYFAITTNTVQFGARAQLYFGFSAFSVDGYFAFDHLTPGGTVWQTGPGGEDDIGRVTVTYPWTLMTPLIRPFFTGGRINISVQSSMKNEKKFS